MVTLIPASSTPPRSNLSGLRRRPSAVAQRPSRRRGTDTVAAMRRRAGARGTEALSESIAEAIARRAYELYSARGCEDGHDVDDWLNAERELRADTTSTAA